MYPPLSTPKYTQVPDSPRSGDASVDKAPTIDTAKKWLNKRLWKPVSRPLLRTQGSDGASSKLSLVRPSTAPSYGATESEKIPPVPQIPPRFEPPKNRPSINPPARAPEPPSRAPRYDSVVREVDVDAWLDRGLHVSPPASFLQSPQPAQAAQPLMEGLSYWQIAPAGTVSAPRGLQYAIPIQRQPEYVRPVTPYNPQVESVYRRSAKAMQAKIPTLQRTAAQRVPAHEQDDLHSESMPLLAVPYEQTVQGASPKAWTPPNYSWPNFNRTSGPSASNEGQTPSTPGRSSSDVLHSGSARTSATSNQADGGHEGRRRLRNGRPSTLGTQRDESMGDLTLSDAPTYSTGPTLPPYSSRPLSIKSASSTCSFGCIDGYTHGQREINRQRAAMANRGKEGKEGKEGKVKKLRNLFKKT
ncbi:hypothetical protein E8E13_004777 [Curvularia kusanoi]|uniref:Uncharacterized protein n=1 Tax=Curvularia kusanoi TaxID=90978 RepID=A0A9P4T5T7_CURKU|nr:hypothetical protein E8E13_004777 [Curvularia kusanoi]